MTPRTAAAAHRPLDILIIDDNSVDREKLRRALGLRCIFEEAESAAAARPMLAAREYDCVFLDYRLPDMDGVELLRDIYNPETDLASSPVVMLTGGGDAAVMLEALRLGAQDYLSKDNLAPETINIALHKARELFDAKRARREAQEQVQHLHRMDAVGQLTGGIAHDFNNLLTVIIGNVHLLRRRFKAGLAACSQEEVDVKINAIESAASRGADLVRRLMVFTRQRPLTPEAVHLGPCIAETAELLKASLGKNIEICLLLQDDAWPVWADVAEFQNIFINLAINARDAMPSGGRLTVELGNVTLDESYIAQHPAAILGDHTVLTVSDTGSGMTPEVQRRIFEPFFTTKPAGTGTGLGLSMAYGFVRQCGGHISVYSEPERGAVFRVYLPRLAQDDDGLIAVPPAPLPRGHETILVVDDDDVVRAVTAAMLERLGYTVLQAGHGRAALELIKCGQRFIHLMLADLIMPEGLSGIDLAREARTLCPDMRILYTSGYSSSAIPDYHLIQPDEPLISKPYRKDELARRVRETLDAGKEIHDDRSKEKARAGH